MSRPFRLAALLRLRTLAEERAAVRLAEAVRNQDDAEARRLATQEALGTAQLPGSADALGMRAVIASRLALSGLLTEHGTAVVAAEQVVRQTGTEWADARGRTRTLEKLQERHEETERDAELHAEQVVLDEIAGRRAPAVPTTGPIHPPTEEVR
ncbi:MAG TPA: flagellar export protein FliJ [Cellulomonas sp.]